MRVQVLTQRLRARMRALVGLSRPHDSVFVLLLVGIGYLAVARGIENFYPFSTFSMYADTAESSASRMFARGADGAVMEISSFANWTCDREIDLNPANCRESGAYYQIDYVDRDTMTLLARTMPAVDSSTAVSVSLFRRIWRFGEGDRSSIEDCDVAVCTAVRR